MMVDHGQTMINHGRPWSGGQTVARGRSVRISSGVSISQYGTSNPVYKLVYHNYGKNKNILKIHWDFKDNFPTNLFREICSK